MEYLNKVEIIGRTPEHYTEAQISNDVIRFNFQVRIDNSYMSLSGAEVRTVTWVPVTIISHPTGKLRSFVFRPKTPIHIVGRLQMTDRYLPGEQNTGFVVNASEADYLEEPKEEEGAK